MNIQEYREKEKDYIEIYAGVANSILYNESERIEQIQYQLTQPQGFFSKLFKKKDNLLVERKKCIFIMKKSLDRLYEHALRISPKSFYDDYIKEHYKNGISKEEENNIIYKELYYLISCESLISDKGNDYKDIFVDYENKNGLKQLLFLDSKLGSVKNGNLLKYIADSQTIFDAKTDMFDEDNLVDRDINLEFRGIKKEDISNLIVSYNKMALNMVYPKNILSKYFNVYFKLKNNYEYAKLIVNRKPEQDGKTYIMDYELKHLTNVIDEYDKNIAIISKISQIDSKYINESTIKSDNGNNIFFMFLYGIVSNDDALVKHSISLFKEMTDLLKTQDEEIAQDTDEIMEESLKDDREF